MSNFWTSTALEPKRQYRFRLTITAIGGVQNVTNAIWYAKKVGIPFKKFDLQFCNYFVSGI